MGDSLAIEATSHAIDGQGTLHIWGNVRNTGDVDMRWVRVTARVYGLDDALLVEAADLTGLEWIPAGQTSSFQIRFFEAPVEWARFTLSVEGHEHDALDMNVPQPHPGIEIGRIHYMEIGRGGLVCSLIGLLRNTAEMPATHVKVSATLYDAAGHVVGSLSPYLNQGKGVAAEAQMPTEIKFYFVSAPVANYEVMAQGRLRQ